MSKPKFLAKRLKYINYPEPPIEDIENICSSINLELYEHISKDKEKELIQNGKKIANYMDRLNKLKLSSIPNWSIRDISKTLKRVQFQTNEKNKDKYNNIVFIDNIIIDNIIFDTLSIVFIKKI